MPYLSVVVPTMRVGGLDILFAGLVGQTFKDFELVLVDGVKKTRGELPPVPFQFAHVGPLDNPFPLNAFCRYANTGLVHASGEVVVFITDYTWCPPDLLENHARFHLGMNPMRHYCLLGPHNYRQPPELASGFPSYLSSSVERYAQDVDSGRLNQFGYSILEQPFAGSAALLPKDAGAPKDPKLALQKSQVAQIYLHAKNESVRLEHLLEINGWDEALDGTHTQQDRDLGERLYKAGMRYYLDPTMQVEIVNPRGVFPLARRIRPIEANEEYWEARHLAGYPGQVNGWNLRQARAFARLGAP